MEEADERPAFPRMVFVGGLQRSGTTLLAKLAARHSQVTGLVGTPTSEDEGQFVQDVYLDDHEMGSTGGRIDGRPMRWAYHPEAHLVETHARERTGAADRLRTSWAPYLEDPRAPIAVEKSPSNLGRTRFLQALFPDAKFIVITRHPIVQALAVRKWGTRRMRAGLDLGLIIDHWLTAMELFRDDAPLLNSSLVISYENLVDDPRAIMAAVQEFIGVDRENLVIDDVVDHSARYVDYWDSLSAGRFSAMQTGALGASSAQGPRAMAMRLAEHWATGMRGRSTVRSMADRYGARMERFGYTADDLLVSGPWR